MARCYRTGKECFTTRVDADIKRAEIVMMSETVHRRRGDLKDLPTRSYWCEFCRKWHMTSQAKRSTPHADSGI